MSLLLSFPHQVYDLLDISRMRIERGLALQDLITGTYEFVERIELPPQARVYLLDHLADTEHRLSTGGSEKLQFTALLGAFKMAVHISSHGKDS